MNETFSNPVEFTEEFSTTSTPDRRERYMKHSLQLSSSINQSDQECQTDENDLLFSRTSIRNTRNVKENVKNAIATVSYRCAVSIPKARIALQTVCDKMYGHKYYLTPEEQEQFEPSNETQSEQPKSKKARTAQEHVKYNHVLPSAWKVEEYKHNKALHQEVTAAKVLGNSDRGDKSNFIMATSRSQVDGERPSLLLNFLNDDPTKCQMFSLCAIFFAYENREQIVKLIVEIFKQLSVASGEAFSSEKLREKITNIMTDSVTKNLKIEHGVAEMLGSNHIPYYMLCKSYTCENLTRLVLKL